jgi:catalase
MTAPTSPRPLGGTSDQLTTRQGHPIANNQNMRTIGRRGPATLENYAFLEKISHFDRERIPERVVHARGFVAHGEFEAYGTIGDQPSGAYSRAKLFDTAGKKTPVSVRFSTVIHGRDSAETLRDPRGFAVKFRTEDGNWDLVGNNFKMFFIREAMKFPDVVHAFKPSPVTLRQEGSRIFDFISMTPEAMHMISTLFSDKGIPKSWMHMDGAGVNTYKLVSTDGTAVLCKFHWISGQGDIGLKQAEADAIQATELGHASKTVYEAIEAGQFPEWEFGVQVMADGEHPELEFDPLDDTKLWPLDRFPLLPVGKMVLNANVHDHHLENEQIAFGTGVLVDGIDFSDDKMLIGRTFSYSDAQRYRIGPNYLQIPVNQPLVPVATNQRGGQGAYYYDGYSNAHTNYEPATNGALEEGQYGGPQDGPAYSAAKVTQTIELENNYLQPGVRYREELDEAGRDELVSNLLGALGDSTVAVQQRMVGHFLRCDEDWGTRIGAGLGVDLDDARKAVEEVDRYWADRGRPNAGQLPSDVQVS